MANLQDVLVGTDLSERSERAMERAAQLSRANHATLTVLHVAQAGLSVAIRERSRALAEESLRDWYAFLPESDRGAASLRVETGEPFVMLLAQARERNTDLIVLGEPGKKGLKELFVGTTTERVVRHADRPVLVVKQSAKEFYRRVLVAADFSEGAARALRSALQVASAAEFLLVHAWLLPQVGFASVEAAEERMERENELLAQRLSRQVQDGMVELGSQAPPTRIQMVMGNPFFVLRDAIASFRPDLLAMGTHARSGIAIAMVGSLAREMLVEAPCDVLVARA
jgi:nucleotide-binding universal stress UspA family protein